MSGPVDLRAIPGLVQRLRSGRSVAQLQAAKALASLAFSGSSARHAIAEAGAMPILMRLASSESGPLALQMGAAVVLSQMIIDEQDLGEAFVAAGGVPLLVRLLVHGGTEPLQLMGAYMAAAAIQGDCSWGRDAQTALAEAGSIPILVQFIGRDPTEVAVAALRNVFAGRHEYRRAAVAAGAASPLAQRLLGCEPSVLPRIVEKFGDLAAGGPV